MIIAVCLFLTGALFGIYMFLRHLKRRPVPAWAAVLHGAFGATAFGVVVFILLRTPGVALIREALFILVAAICLGVVNLLFHIRRVRHRTILIVLHALTAVTGVGTLAYGAIFVPEPTGPAPSESGAPSSSQSPPQIAKGDTKAPAPSAAATTVAAAPAVAPTPSAVVAAASATPSAAVAAAAPSPSTPETNAFRPGPAWADRPLMFDSASTALDSQARAALADVADALRTHPELTLVEVQGYADETGSDASNVQLAQSRASATVDFLVGKGIARGRLRRASYGARCPADATCQQASAPSSCHQPAALKQDRRVTLLALEVGGQQFHGKVACDRGLSLAPAEDRKYGE